MIINLDTKEIYSIYDKSSENEYSKLFTIPSGAEQVTLSAFGLSEGDCIHIHQIVLSKGEFSSVCGCYVTEALGGEIIAEEPLSCFCGDGRKVTLKITPNNPIVVLNKPQHMLMRCYYHNELGFDNLKDFTVIVQRDTHTPVIECSALAGCVEGCEEYLPTYAFPDCGTGFRPTDKRDPKATVTVESCFGKTLAYIYPKQYQFAQMPIYSCSGELLGYAMQGQSPDCSSHYTCNH